MTGYLKQDSELVDTGATTPAEFDQMFRRWGSINFLVLLFFLLLDFLLLNIELGATTSMKFNIESMKISSSKTRISTSSCDREEFESEEMKE